MMPSGRTALRLMNSVYSLLAAGLLCALLPGAAPAFAPRPVPGRLLVKLHDWVDVSSLAGKATSAASGIPALAALEQHFGLLSMAAQFPGETPASKALAGHDLSRWFVLDFRPDVGLDALQQAYAAAPAVERADLDLMMPVDLATNDSSLQWHLESAQGYDAHVTGGWNHSVGDTSVVLAIADTGVDWRHPDLGGTAPGYFGGSIWINWAEKNGVPGDDDDGNGYVDDVRGYDFVQGLSNAWPGEDAGGLDNDPADFNGHGTHVAGIAGATTHNGLGVAGVGYRCKVMALRIGGSIDAGGAEQGVVLMSAAASAINYARLKGATAVNCSWGSSNSGGLGAAVSSAVAAGMVIVVAAGNDHSEGASYLSSRGDCFDVAATDGGDRLASFSNYGTWVDVAAPGVGIYSTYYDHNPVDPLERHAYALLQGTSMAAPVVTGLVGLVKARWPYYNGAQIKLAIRDGADSIDALNPAYAGKLGSGRVNALRTFFDRFITVPDDYLDLDVAIAASGAGDTLALRGGDVHLGGLYLHRSRRLLLGGWNAAYTARDPLGNPTIIRPLGDQPAVEIVVGVDTTLVVDGLHFENGAARALTTPLVGLYGGGVLCIGASPTFVNCRFKGNVAGSISAPGSGGGGFVSNSSARFIDCTFAGNTAFTGGGLFLYDADVTLRGCTFDGNVLYDASGVTSGAGLSVEGGTLTLRDVIFSAGVGADEGGGLWAKNAVIDARNVLCTGNGANNSGGAIRLLTGADLTLHNAELRNGTALFGAGIALASGATLTLRASLLADNVAQFLGGGIYSQSGAATLENVTFDANRGTAGGGDALYAVTCPTGWTLRNSIVSNHPTAVNPACVFGGAAPNLDYNLFFGNAGGHVGGAALGPDDVIADPRFAANRVPGLHSPALDSGDPTAGDDPDGTRCDRGASGGPFAASPAPGPPQGLTATHQSAPARNELVWNANPEPDLQWYAVYRGTSAGFVPSAANFVASVAAGTTSFSDATGAADEWYRLAAVDTAGASSGFGPAVQALDATDVPVVPTSFALLQNAPNPFNPSTLLRFDLPQAGHARLEVFDAAGRRVRRLVDAWMPAGERRISWDGTSDGGRDLPSGVYVYRLAVGSWSAARKMILAR